MAIDHDVLFRKIGKLAKNANALATLNSTTLPASLAEIVAQYGTSATGVSTAQAPIEGINAEFARLQQAITSVRLAILGYSDRTAGDYDTVLSQLAGFSGAGLGGLLYYLIWDFIDQGETVDRSVVTIGAVTSATRNVGNGTVLLDGYLDGYNAPLNGGISHPAYSGWLTELSPPSVSHVWECVSDVYGTGQSDGGESFTWTDGFDFGEASGFGDNAGPGPGLTSAGGVTYLSDGEFENWSDDDEPTSWDVEYGTTGTHIKQEVGTVYRGNSCLALVGDGSQEIVRLGQALGDGRVNPLRRFLVCLRTRLADKAPLAGSLDVHVVGDGDYTTATGGSSLYVPLTSMTTSWVLRYFYWTAPANLATGLRLNVGLADTPTLGTKVLIDDVFFVPVTYHAGINAVMVPGNVPPAVGDRMYATVTNSEQTVQKFLRTHWKIQLPSASGVSGSFGALMAPYGLFVATSSGTVPDAWFE